MIIITTAPTSESHTYGNGTEAVTFLSNIATDSSVNITFGGSVFTVLPWSVSIVYAGEVLFNTAVVPYTAAKPRTMTKIGAFGPDSSAVWYALVQVN